jgi:hypothetical protein
VRLQFWTKRENPLSVHYKLLFLLAALVTSMLLLFLLSLLFATLIGDLSVIDGFPIITCYRGLSWYASKGPLFVGDSFCIVYSWSFAAEEFSRIGLLALSPIGADTNPLDLLMLSILRRLTWFAANWWYLDIWFTAGLGICPSKDIVAATGGT